MILVTGGTGHLGSELIPLLTARREAVRVLTRDPDRARQRLGAIAEFTPGDARNPSSLEPALGGVDTVVSAMTGFGPGGNGAGAIDYEANLNLIRAAEAAGVRRFVLMSMHGAAADHPMGLLRMKHRAELALRESQLDWTIVRPNPFMELWAGIVGDPIAKGGKATVFGGGNNQVNFNSVQDVARAVELALFDPSLSRAALDVGGPENLTFNELVRRIEAAAGRKAKVKHIPVAMMRMSRLLLRPFRPDIAGLIEAGIAFDTIDMSFDASELRSRFPGLARTHMDDVILERFSASKSRTTERMASG
ncbi:MAG: SDR family oxidoreductase [Candidatus Dormibacteraeota bacterium]|nr:SDR family oxidoreductase [Candidatus Dormibacteraeota bacterium]